MPKISRRVAAGLVVAVSAALAGCGGNTGSKPHAQINAVDVGTNLVNTSNNIDTGTVLVNGGASYEQEPYATPSRDLFVQSGTSSFQASTSMTLPTYTPVGATAATSVPPPTSSDNLVDGGTYTAFLVGRPDVPNPTQSNLSDLDARYIKVVVLPDNQAAPTAGHATVRAFSAVTDPSTPNVDIYVSGQGTAAPVFANVPYASQTTGATADQQLTAGTVTVSANIAGTGTVLLAPTSVTLVPGTKYTLVITEPTATYAGSGTAPTPPPTTTYGVALVSEP
jgi:hypothetical protein